MNVTKADLLHVKTVLENYKFFVEEYPEYFSDEEEDELKIVLQLIKEKLE